MRSALAVLLLSCAVSAQIIPDPPIEASFTGVVELTSFQTAGANPPCFIPNYMLRCTGLFVQSSTIDLAQYVGQNVKLFGTSVFQCDNIFEITAVDPDPPATLAFCGNPVPGCDIRLRSGPGGTAQHFLFVAAAPGLVPLSLGKGAFLLGEPNLLLAAGVFSDVDGAAFDFTLPRDVSLTGIPVFFQAARREILLGSLLRFSNNECFTILGPSPPCIVDPDC